MKKTVPAVDPAALSKLARGKTRRVAQKLQVAEQELHTANTALMDALPPKVRREVTDALDKSASAEEKVREATEELEVVTELLTLQEDQEAQQAEDAQVARDGRDAALLPQAGNKSGHGAQSVMLHIQDEARGKPGW